MSEQNITEIIVEGMTCSNCALAVQRKLEKEGMHNVNVNFASGEVRFVNETHKPLEEITDSVEDLGYKVISDNDKSQKKNF